MKLKGEFMRRPVPKSPRKTGLPTPGRRSTSVSARVDTTRLMLLHYNEPRAIEPEIKTVEESNACRNTSGVRWINVTGLYEAEQLEQFGTALRLYPRVIEGVLNTEFRDFQ
jgi:hypothetical protein